MSSRKKSSGTNSATSAPRLSRPLLLLIVGAAVAVVSGIILLATRPSGPDLSAYTPEVSGGPHLEVVSPETVDYGDVAVNTPIQAEFRIRNTGDQVLRIANEPQVELVRGC